MNDQVKRYWEDRAERSASAITATTNDVYLRELEIITLTETLREWIQEREVQVLDIGCGDGYATLALARTLPKVRVRGIDYSRNMIRIAKQRLEINSSLAHRVCFELGDVMELSAVVGKDLYDVVITDRCLINLQSREQQFNAIHNIAEQLKPSGCYLMIENFIEGHKRFNDARRAIGLNEIPVRWHNLFFEEDSFFKEVQALFTVKDIKDFASSYYLATRLLYAAMCKERGEEPNYTHDIHRLALKLPWTGQFSPIRLVVLVRNSI
jgi:ubiquinone/menaquinone biosynthesis C-methylase UbiE